MTEEKISQEQLQEVYLALIGRMDSNINIIPEYFTVIKRIDNNYCDLFYNNTYSISEQPTNDSSMVLKKWHFPTIKNAKIPVEDIQEVAELYNDICGYNQKIR